MEANNKHVLLLLLFAFSFIYRVVTMLWQTFPPGADIGLHNSVIHSIMGTGSTDFFWNNYQMGGGLSLTFPGYHIFTSAVILMTGMPDYFAQAIVVAFFSSLIVLCAYLVTRAAWTESGALVVAFIVAVSRFDIETLLWGGYPNAITLVLIPLTFYLFLQRNRFSLAPFLVCTSILAGSIFLTHSLSAVIFVSVTFTTVMVVMVASKFFNASRKHVLSWLLPIFFGAALVSPFLAKAVPAYLNSNSTFTGITDIQKALVSSKVVPLELVIPLFACFPLFFALSKYYKGKFLSLPTLLFATWLLLPLILTQGYLFGLYLDFNRFLYFLLLPVAVLLAMFIDHGAAFFAQIIDNYRVWSSHFQKGKALNKYAEKIAKKITRKSLYGGFLVALLLAVFFLFPLLVTPWQGQSVADFYQVMNNPGYEAIQWVKQNTPPNSVFVSDALYGWWLGGFAQRPTLSAVSPEYLTVNREVNPAKNATLLMDTAFMIDNGYMQVREDGGYIGRHNPMFLANLNWTYYPFAFFQFDSSQIDVLSNNSITDITQVPVVSMQLVGAETDSPAIVVNKANSNFSYSEIITVPKASTFANMTIIIQSNKPDNLQWVEFTIYSQGQIKYADNNTIAILDEPMKECGQIIFEGTQPYNVTNKNQENPCITFVSYNLNGKSTVQLQMLVGIYQVSEEEVQNSRVLKQTVMKHVTGNRTANVALPITTFDYQKAIQDYSVSYIANRDFGLNPKYECDPAFSLVFINSEVAIFKVKANIKPAG